SSTRCARSSTATHANCAVPRIRKSSTASCANAGTARPARTASSIFDVTNPEDSRETRPAGAFGRRFCYEFLARIGYIEAMFELLNVHVRVRRQPLDSGKRTQEIGHRALPLRIRDPPRSTRISLRIKPGARGLTLTVLIGPRKVEIDDFLDRHQG